MDSWKLSLKSFDEILIGISNVVRRIASYEIVLSFRYIIVEIIELEIRKKKPSISVTRTYIILVETPI